MLDIILISAASLLGYCAGAGMTYRFMESRGVRDEVGMFFGSAGWPITSSVMLGMSVVDKASALFHNKTTPKALQYADSPLTILANMVCQRVLASPEAHSYEKWKKDGITVDYFESSFRLHHIEISRKEGGTVMFKSSDFSDADQIKILKALKKSFEISKEKKAMEVLATKRHAALDAVENLMDLPSIEPSLLTVERN